MCRNPENHLILELSMVSYATFSEPFHKIANGAGISTAKINLEFGATCHLGSAAVLTLNRYTFMEPRNSSCYLK